MEHTIVTAPKIRMVTPYMYHHFIEALVQNNHKEIALSLMRAYWGEMVKDGADTFWELYDPAIRRFPKTKTVTYVSSVDQYNKEQREKF